MHSPDNGRESLLRRFAQQANEFNALFRLLQDIYFRVDSSYLILDYKSVGESDLYLPPEDFLGRRLAEVLPADVAERLMGRIDVALATGELTSTLYRLEVGGQNRDWEARLVPVTEDEVALICRDVTDRLRRESALAESESRYRVLVELSPYAIYLVGKDERISFANAAAARLLGAGSVADLVGMPIGDFVPPGAEGWDDLESQRDIVDQLSRYSESGELPATGFARARVRRLDGVVIDVDRTMAGVFVAGEPTLLVMSHDVSDRIAAEHDIRSSRDLLSRLLEMLDAGVVLLDADGRILMTNRPAEELVGAEPGGLLGLLTADLAADEPDFLEFRDAALHATTSGGYYRAEVVLRTMRGETFDAEVSSRYIGDGSGSRVATVRDITERKRAERRLQESEAGFRRLVDESPFGMHLYRLDDQGRLVLTGMNPASERLLGHDAALFLGKSLEEAFPELCGTEVEAAYRRIVEEGGTFHSDLVTYQDDLVSGAFDVTAFSTGPGELAVAFADVTERRAIAEREQHHKDRLRALTSELASAEDRERRRLAEELHDRVSQSLAAARIRLRQAETLGAGEGMDDVSKAARLIEGAIAETRAITTELFPPVLYELGISAAIHWLCDELERVHGITCSRHIEDLPCDSDEAKAVLFRAARELMANVAKHSLASRARVGLVADGGEVVLTVADNGIGFDTERVTTGTGDSGFGLFSIKERLPYAGGSIEIESATGQGTTVTIRVSCCGDDRGSQIQ